MVQTHDIVQSDERDPQRLAISIGLHVTWNFCQAAVYGFPVSGLANLKASFVVIEQGGPRTWTGGSFGPEAGLLGLLTMALGAALILLWVRWRHGAVRLAAVLAEPPAGKRE